MSAQARSSTRGLGSQRHGVRTAPAPIIACASFALSSRTADPTRLKLLPVTGESAQVSAEERVYIDRLCGCEAWRGAA
jgi:hypothetical protein